MFIAKISFKKVASSILTLQILKTLESNQKLYYVDFVKLKPQNTNYITNQ